MWTGLIVQHHFLLECEQVWLCKRYILVGLFNKHHKTSCVFEEERCIYFRENVVLLVEQADQIVLFGTIGSAHGGEWNFDLGFLGKSTIWLACSTSNTRNSRQHNLALLVKHIELHVLLVEQAEQSVHFSILLHQHSSSRTWAGLIVQKVQIGWLVQQAPQDLCSIDKLGTNAHDSFSGATKTGKTPDMVQSHYTASAVIMYSICHKQVHKHGAM